MISLSIDRVSCIVSDLSKQPNRMDRTPRGVLGPRGRETQRSNRIEPTLPHAHAGARQVNPDRVQVASSGLRGSDTFLSHLGTSRVRSIVVLSPLGC